MSEYLRLTRSICVHMYCIVLGDLIDERNCHKINLSDGGTYINCIVIFAFGNLICLQYSISVLELGLCKIISNG